MLGHHLNSLESIGLIRLAATLPDVEYLFRHTLVQEAAYHSLVKRDRAHLHRAVGETLERMYADRAGELAALLAKHFDEAGDDERALKYFTLAGERAAATYANAEAVMHYTRALEIARRRQAASSVLRSLYLGMGRALELSASDDRALLIYDEMEVTARKAGDRAMELAAQLALATIYLKPAAVRDLDRGRALAERTLALARDWGDRESEAKSLWNLMQYYKWFGRMEEAIAYGEQALALARELNLREQLAYVLNDIASAYGISGQIQRARALLEEARQLWRGLGVLNMLADSLASSAEMHALGGEYDQALALSREALSVSQTIGNVWNQSYSWYMIDLVHMDRGEMTQAIEAAEECLRLARLAGFVPGMMQSLFDLAWIYGDLGALQRGYEVAELFRSTMTDMPLLGLFGGVMEARLHLCAGKLAEARRAFDEIRRDVARDALSAYALLFFDLVDAEVHMGAGDYARVLALADEALPLLREAGIRLFLTDALYLKGRALLALNRVEEGRDTLTDARVLAEAIGSRRTLWRILAALSEIEAGRGNRSEAEALRRQAVAIIDFIVDHCPPELRAPFLKRSDVRHVMSGA